MRKIFLTFCVLFMLVSTCYGVTKLSETTPTNSETISKWPSYIRSLSVKMNEVIDAIPGASPWVVVTGGETAVDGGRYLVDTSSIAATITLPATPIEGMCIVLGDAKGTWGSNAVTIARNGSNINGAAADYILSSTLKTAITIVYQDSSYGWSVQGFGLGDLTPSLPVVTNSAGNLASGAYAESSDVIAETSTTKFVTPSGVGAWFTNLFNRASYNLSYVLGIFNGTLHVTTEAQLIAAQANSLCKQVRIIAPITLTANLTLTKALAEPPVSSVITLGDFNLTLNGSVPVVSYKMFDLTGSGVLTGTGIKAITPEMVGAAGDGVTNDTTAVKNAIASLVTTGGELVLVNHNVVSSATTFPGTVVFKITGSGQLVVPSGTMTINSRFSGHPGCFSVSGGGSVVFGASAVDEVYPEWWTVNTTPGTTNMSTAITYAANSIPLGGMVKFAANDYLCSPLTFTSLNKVRWVGASSGITRLLLASTGKLATFSNCQSIELEYLTFATSGNPQSIAGSYGVRLDTGSGNAKISRCWFLGFAENGLELVGTSGTALSGNKVIGCYFLGNGGNQLYSSYNSDFHIEDNQYGILSGYTHADIGCYLEYSSAGNYTGNYHWNNVIGFKALDSNYNRIVGNRFEQSDHEGVYYDGGAHIVFTSNTIHTNSLTTKGAYDNAYFKDLTTSTVTGNSSLDWTAGATTSHRYSFYFDAGCHYNSIQADICSGYTTDAIYLADADTNKLGGIVGATPTSPTPEEPIDWAAFYASKSATQTLGTGPTTVTFETATQNIGSGYSVGTSTFTAPYTGYYVFGVMIQRNTSTNAGMHFTLSIIAGSTTFTHSYAIVSGTQTLSMITPLVYLEQDDTVHVSCSRLSGSYDIATTNDAAQNIFYGYQVR